MKKNLLIATAICIILSVNIYAFEPVEHALGFSIGTDKGFNYLTHDGQGHGYQANLSIDLGSSDNKFIFSADKLFFSLIGDNVPVYTGFGIKISDNEDEYVGLRAVAGISYFFEQLDDDLELYAEITPTVYLDNLSDLFSFEYSLGARYYF